MTCPPQLLASPKRIKGTPLPSSCQSPFAPLADWRVRACACNVHRRGTATQKRAPARICSFEPLPHVRNHLLRRPHIGPQPRRCVYRCMRGPGIPMRALPRTRQKRPLVWAEMCVRLAGGSPACSRLSFPPRSAGHDTTRGATVAGHQPRAAESPPRRDSSSPGWWSPPNDASFPSRVQQRCRCSLQEPRSKTRTAPRIAGGFLTVVGQNPKTRPAAAARTASPPSVRRILPLGSPASGSWRCGDRPAAAAAAAALPPPPSVCRGSCPAYDP
eukprot:227090-Chlamydomonas_euryale.AAC.2